MSEPTVVINEHGKVVIRNRSEDGKLVRMYMTQDEAKILVFKLLSQIWTMKHDEP